MARGQNTAGHPNRQVHKSRFGVGDTVHMPGLGPVNIESMGRKYFTGRTSSGAAVGKTGIGLAAGEGMHGGPAPWKIEKKQQ